MTTVKKLRLAKFGVVIASIMLTAGYAQGNESEATKEKTPLKTEASELAKAEAATKLSPSSLENEPTGYDLYHKVVETENLWVLAKRFTGDANNWKAIAEANGLDEKGTVKPGQTIRIPAALNKVAIESVPSPVKTGIVANATKGDAKESTKTVTIPASFKGEAPADLPKKSSAKAAD